MEAYSRRVLEGPRRGEKGHVKLFLTEPDVILIQPALSCHCVLTLSSGPALVTDWEASDPNDDKRKGQVLRYYTRGVCARRIRKMSRLKTAEMAEEIAEEDGAELSEAGAQLVALSERVITETPVQKRPRVQRKRNSWKNLPRVKAALEKNEVSTVDFSLFCFVL